MDNPNTYLWALPDFLGRLFWLPLVGYGAFGLIYLYKLAAPATRLGRIIRVMMSLAFMCLVFSPFLNGLGPYAMHLMGLGSMLIVYQVYQQCLADGRIIKPTSETAIERMADRVKEPHRQEAA